MYKYNVKFLKISNIITGDLQKQVAEQKLNIWKDKMHPSNHLNF